MTAWLCISVAVLAFLFGVGGLYLQKLLPEPHSVDLSRDMMEQSSKATRFAAARSRARNVDRLRLLLLRDAKIGTGDARRAERFNSTSRWPNSGRTTEARAGG